MTDFNALLPTLSSPTFAADCLALAAAIDRETAGFSLDVETAAALIPVLRKCAGMAEEIERLRESEVHAWAAAKRSSETCLELRASLRHALDQNVGLMAERDALRDSASEIKRQEAEIERLRSGIENIRLFAARQRDAEWAKTVLRFCKDAGATGSPLRTAQTTSGEGDG